MVKEITATKAKTMMRDSLMRFMRETFERNGRPEVAEMLAAEGTSSIKFELPPDFFRNCLVPEGTTLEIKLINKRV